MIRCLLSLRSSVRLAMAARLNRSYRTLPVSTILEWRPASLEQSSYCSPNVKTTPVDAAILLWFSLVPDERPGNRVST